MDLKRGEMHRAMSGYTIPCGTPPLPLPPLNFADSPDDTEALKLGTFTEKISGSASLLPCECSWRGK